MKTIFFSASSSYIHTLLAPRYLAENCTYPVKIVETNVNVPLEKNLTLILAENPDIVAFSCYIFNTEYLQKIIFLLKNALPQVKIIIGGYEAAFNTELYENTVDYIIKGEGDFVFGKLIESIANNDKTFPKIIEAGTVERLDDINSPYTDEYCSLSAAHHILYMETCRGCPFGCAYCMSANTHGVRSFSLPRIFSDFDRIMKHNPPLLKLVDRTFNYDVKRAAKIFEFLIEKYGNSDTRFHFEMAPELFNEELFSVIQSAPTGLFQFEIGVQSYNNDTLSAVNRHAKNDIIDKNLRRLADMKNVHIHVDLIAGLPYENFDSFTKGFDRLFLNNPTCLQLGFLKILPGSKIYSNCEGYTVQKTPPYEIISSPCMSESDLNRLRRAEKMLNRYYNSGRYRSSMEFLINQFFSPFEFFDRIADFYEQNHNLSDSPSAQLQSDVLFAFGQKFLSENDAAILERNICRDFIASGNTRRWHKWIKL